jgi:hypothetical protein
MIKLSGKPGRSHLISHPDPPNYPTQIIESIKTKYLKDVIGEK